MTNDGFIFDKETIARLLISTLYNSTDDEFTHKKATMIHLPLVNLYRPEDPHPAPAKFVLFFADDNVNMADVQQFKDKIGASGIIAICPYHQYFDCLAYTDSIIFCHFRDIGYLLAWLENPITSYINIDSNDLEALFNTHKFFNFNYFYGKKDRVAIQFKTFIKQQVKKYLPPIKKQVFLLDIYCSEDFTFEDYIQITDTSRDEIDISEANIYFGINFSMPVGEYALHLLIA